MPLRELATRILAQEGKPPDQPIKFHMTPFVPVAGMEGVAIRYLMVGRRGPVEMLRPGVYVETTIPPAQFEAFPGGIRKKIIKKIEKHINARVKRRKIKTDRYRRRLIKKCRFPSSYSPLGFLMFKVVPEGIT